MDRILIEACCGSADDAMQAEAGGADRVELNSCLFMGGLTPSLGMLETVKEHTRLPVMVMLRPRPGGFDYTETEFEAMLRDAKAFLAHGADGLVFGFLNADGTVNTRRTLRMQEAAEGRETVFHRAFDVTPDWKQALDTLISLGIGRVLTSWQRRTAWEGRYTIRDMISRSFGSIQILPGAGITPENAPELIALTGADQIHLGGKRRQVCDLSASRAGIRFSGETVPAEDRFEISDRAVFQLLREWLNERKG